MCSTTCFRSRSRSRRSPRSRPRCTTRRWRSPARMRTASRSGFRTGTVVTTDDRNWELRYTLSRAALQPEPGGGDRHGIGDRRGAGLSLPRALRDLAVRFRQAAPWRAEAARPGQCLLRAGDQPAPADRHRNARPSCATKATASTAASCAASTSRRCARAPADPILRCQIGDPARAPAPADWWRDRLRSHRDRARHRPDRGRPPAA